MSFKGRMVYVVMRASKDLEDNFLEDIPVGIFTDLETAEGNAEGYNLTMKEDGIEGLHFHVKVTMLYE